MRDADEIVPASAITIKRDNVTRRDRLADSRERERERVEAVVPRVFPPMTTTMTTTTARLMEPDRRWNFGNS